MRHMRRWLMKKLGIFKMKHEAELKIIEQLQRMNLSGDDRDEIVSIVMEALHW